METLGKHCIINLQGCSFEQLDDIDYIVNLIQQAAVVSGATILNTVSHKFSPQGVTALCLLSESHVSIHTYPEIGKCFADIYCCGDANPKIGCQYILDNLKPTDYNMDYITR